MSTTTVMTSDELKKQPPLTEEEKRVLHDANPTPTDDCPAMTAGELKEFRPWHTRQKKPVTINLDSGAIEYFKSLAEETGVSYQNLINMYLVQCAREKSVLCSRKHSAQWARHKKETKNRPALHGNLDCIEKKSLLDGLEIQ